MAPSHFNLAAGKLNGNPVKGPPFRPLFMTGPCPGGRARIVISMGSFRNRGAWLIHREPNLQATAIRQGRPCIPSRMPLRPLNRRARMSLIITEISPYVR